MINDHTSLTPKSVIYESGDWRVATLIWKSLCVNTVKFWGGGLSISPFLVYFQRLWPQFLSNLNTIFCVEGEGSAKVIPICTHAWLVCICKMTVTHGSVIEECILNFRDHNVYNTVIITVGNLKVPLNTFSC